MAVRFLAAFLLAWSIVGICSEPVSKESDSSVFDQAAALEFSQAAIGRTLGNYRFTDRHNQPLSLAELHGKPLVISLIYTSCYHTCSVLTRRLAEVVEIAREALGEDSFTVLTIGFDSRADTPEQMRIYAMQRGVDLPGWYFLSADQATIEDLTDKLGFIFFSSPKGFDHTAQITVVDAQGQIYRQVYGESFLPQNLVEPLKQLVFGVRTDAGILSDWVNGVRLFCTIYDPSSGRYRFDYSIFISIFIGVLCLSGVAVFLLRAWRESRPAKPTA